MAAQDFEMFSGDSVILKIEVTDNTTQLPYDFTDAVEIRWGVLIDGTLVEKKLTNGKIVVNGAGDISVFIDPADTENHSGKYSHELEIEDVNNNIYTVFRAILTIKQDILE